jgi:quercetin dioxygenase-like cupin family protein
MLRLKNTAMAVLVIAGTSMGSIGSMSSMGLAHAEAPSAIVTPLMTKPLDEYPGKEALMITVEYPPGAVDPVHRHHAYGFIYVLEGSIVMQVKGGKEVTLTPGQTFYEGPNDVHTVGRNASQTQPAKFVVLLLKNKAAPVLVPEK